MQLLVAGDRLQADQRLPFSALPVRLRQGHAQLQKEEAGLAHRQGLRNDRQVPHVCLLANCQYAFVFPELATLLPSLSSKKKEFHGAIYP
jgi:hypothetical protein